MMNKLKWLGTISLAIALSACGSSSENVGGTNSAQGGNAFGNVTCPPGYQNMGRLGCVPAGMDSNSACNMLGGYITFTNGQWICVKTMNYQYGRNYSMINPAAPLLRPDQPNRLDAALMNQGTANWVPNGMGGGGYGYNYGGYFGNGGYYNNQLLVFPGDKVIYSGRGKWGLPEHGCSRHNFNGDGASLNNGKPQGLLMSTGSAPSMQLLGNASGKIVNVTVSGALYVGLNIPQSYMENRPMPACAIIEQAPRLEIQLCASISGQPIACP